MKPNEQIEGVYAEIALIESFYVLVHDSKDVYLVVEKKHIPENALINERPCPKGRGIRAVRCGKLEECKLPIFV